MLYHPHVPYPLTDLEVKVTDREFFCLIKCLYHISQSSESIHISNRVCFHSIVMVSFFPPPVFPRGRIRPAHFFPGVETD